MRTLHRRAAHPLMMPRARQELERPIKVNMDMGGATQFGRASMRREADREVREARFSSTMDIGAA